MLMTVNPRHRPARQMINPFQICIFEDDRANDLAPYQITRPVYTVPCGSYTLVERIQRYLPDHTITLLCHQHHEPFVKQRYSNLNINFLNKSLPTLFINGAVSFSNRQFNDLLSSIDAEKQMVFIHHNTVIAIYSPNNQSDDIFSLLMKRPSFDAILEITRNSSVVEQKTDLYLVKYWWDYILHLSSHLHADFNDFAKRSFIEGHVSGFCKLINEHNMYIDKHATIHDFTVLDASNGPIFIDAHVVIEPFSRIVGPCFIGSDCTIKSHAQLNTVHIGRHCKVGGEVSRSIIQSYSNKAHHGFLGDSIVGEWVNLGAGTTTSNLKLSYGTIQSPALSHQSDIQTEQQFLGAIFGDFVKTGINTSFECGAVIGSCSSIYGTQPQSKFIPPFTWGSTDNYSHQQIVALIESINRMMTRRSLSLTEDIKMVLKVLYDQVKHPTAH